jgi:hypothetical protein
MKRLKKETGVEIIASCSERHDNFDLFHGYRGELVGGVWACMNATAGLKSAPP